MKISEERINSVLDKVANNFGLTKWSYIRNEIDETIENYFGILIPVTLVGTGNERDFRKPIFMKFAPHVDEKLKDITKQHYEVEEYVYRSLFPIYKRISNVNIDEFIPKCFYADLEPNNEVLVLKDMRSVGFKRYDKEGFLDKEHIRLSLEALAKYHALSIIFKKEGGDFDNSLTKPYTDTHVIIYYLQIEKSLQRQVRSFNNTIYGGYIRRLASNLANFMISSTTEARYLVYGHGDFSKENILFKYENFKPVLACLIDFQKTRRMSPALDILMFLLSSVGVTDINQHHEYLNTYLDTFERILKENGVDNTYSADDLNHDMKVVAPYAIAIAVMSFSLWLGVEDDTFIQSKNVSENLNENIIVLKNTIIDILEELNTFGYIQF